MPSQRRYQEMQQELEYKKQQVSQANSTQERLEVDLQSRKSELEKISTLEEKIRVEMTALSDKMTKMEEELEVRREMRV